MKAEFDREHEVGPAGPARALAQPRLATAQRRTAPHSAAQVKLEEMKRQHEMNETRKKEARARAQTKRILELPQAEPPVKLVSEILRSEILLYEGLVGSCKNGGERQQPPRLYPPGNCHQPFLPVGSSSAWQLRAKSLHNLGMKAPAAPRFGH